MELYADKFKALAKFTQSYADFNINYKACADRGVGIYCTTAVYTTLLIEE